MQSNITKDGDTEAVYIGKKVLSNTFAVLRSSSIRTMGLSTVCTKKEKEVPTVLFLTVSTWTGYLPKLRRAIPFFSSVRLVEARGRKYAF